MIECGPKKMEVAMYAGLKYISQEKNSQEQRGVRWNYVKIFRVPPDLDLG